MLDVINLYRLKDCPKCNILEKVCSESKYVKLYSTFDVFEIDPSNAKDPAFNLLIEKGITQMPVLLVNDNFYDFNSAMEYIRKKDKEVR